MPLLTALAISIGVLGGVATYLFLGPLGATGIQLWVVFAAWPVSIMSAVARRAS